MIGITGSSGVLGSILCKKFTGNNVDFSNYEGDINDVEILSNWVLDNNLTYIIHLASKVAVKDVDENIDSAYDVNICGTVNLIKAIKKYNKPIGLFYASSSHVYRSSIDLIKESDPVEPINSYGLTKYVSELILSDYSKKDTNLSLCIGRIFSFYHSSQKPPFLFPNLLKRFENEDLTQPFKLFGAYSTRDFLNAEEVCDIIIQLMNLKHKGIVNIASGKPKKIIDFVQEISPVSLNFDIDQDEKITHLNADISILKKILLNDK